MATQPWENPAAPVTTDERYESASCTSDMTVGGGMIPKDHKVGAGDVVAAAGMACSGLKRVGPGEYVLLPPNDSSIGMALLRLHSEWSASAKPRRVTPEAITRLIAEMQAEEMREYEKSTARGPQRPFQPKGGYVVRANAEAERWYANELLLLANRLKSRSDVLDQLSAWAALKGIAADVVPEALLHWLSPTCRHCDGHGLRFVEHQATRQCHECNGGERKRTEGVDRVLRQIDYALGIARGSLKRRLRRE